MNWPPASLDQCASWSDIPTAELAVVEGMVARPPSASRRVACYPQLQLLVCGHGPHTQDVWNNHRIRRRMRSRPYNGSLAVYTSVYQRQMANMPTMIKAIAPIWAGVNFSFRIIRV